MADFYLFQDSIKIDTPVQEQDPVVNPVSDTTHKEITNQRRDSVADTPGDSLGIIKIVKKPAAVKLPKIPVIADTAKAEDLTQRINESWNSPEDLARQLYLRDSLTTSSIPADNSGLKNIFKKKTEYRFDWSFWIFIILLFLFVWVQLFYKKYFNLLFKSTISYHSSSKLFNEKNVLVKRVSLVVNFIYIVVLVMFCYILGIHFYIIDPKTNTFNFFLTLFDIIIVISILKVIIHKTAGYIFNLSNLVNEYLHHTYVINKSLGIILFPVTFAAFFAVDKTADFMVIAGILFCIASFLIKIFRSTEIIIQNGIFNFYSILYLCTLEFLPIIVGYRLLKILM